MGAEPLTGSSGLRATCVFEIIPPARALDRCERVVPVFCFDDRLLRGRHASGPRTQFMLESLADLDERLGGTLVFRHGPPERELPRWRATREPASCTSARIRAVRPPADRACHGGPRAAASSRSRTRACTRRRPRPDSHPAGRPYTVFSPFHRSWLREPRREPIG
jgi:deoxyribodipyrimidine photo-lyase